MIIKLQLRVKLERLLQKYNFVHDRITDVFYGADGRGKYVIGLSIEDAQKDPVYSILKIQPFIKNGIIKRK